MNPATLTTHNPSTGEVLATLPVTPSDTLSTLFAQARQAQREWSKLPVKIRASKLLDARECLLDQRDALTRLITAENGKPPFEAFSAEVFASADLLTYYAKHSHRILRPKSLPLSLFKYRRSRLEYAPVGVAAVISPWNYPFLLPMGEIAPLLVAGNAVIFKPSEVTPLIGLEIQKIFDQAEFPKHLLQTVIGDGQLGQALIEQKPDKIFFTGSVATGKKVMTQAAGHLIPVNLELGGKDALIVLEDADLDYASSAVLWGSFANSGQVCASTERLLVHESVAAEFKRLIAAKAARLTPGDLGAITFEKQKLVYTDHIAEARASGAEIVFGGEFNSDRTRLAPTLVTGPKIESLKVYTEETFGPVVAMTTFKSDEEAITKANDSRYGLLAAIITGNVARARSIASRLEVGTITINEVLYTAGMAETPWGGIKESGIGRSHGEFGLLEGVHVRHIHEPRFQGLWFKSPWWYPYTPIQLELFKRSLELYRRAWTRKLAALPGLLAQGIRTLLRDRRI